jgi:hypothetical protein
VDQMSADVYPLNAAQRRRLTIFLSFAERDLRRLRDTIAHPPHDLVLTRYDDPIPDALVPKLLAAAADAEQQIHKIARELKLQPIHETVRRGIYSALSIDEVDMHELRPKRLRGFGEVEKDTEHYLESEIRMLQELFTHLNKLLLHGVTEDGDAT